MKQHTSKKESARRLIVRIFAWVLSLLLLSSSFYYIIALLLSR